MVIMDAARGYHEARWPSRDRHRSTGSTMAISSWSAPFGAVMSFLVEGLAVTEHASDELAIDGLDLPARSELERVGGNAVDVA